VRHYQPGRGLEEATMKRAALFSIAIVCLAQHSRDDSRATYRTWREADPNLEREAVAGGAPIAQRADRLAAEAAKYAAARKALLEGIADEEGKQIAWIESSATPPESQAVATDGDAKFVNGETARITRTIGTFAGDPDRGIQQLRQALEREKVALTALTSAIAERQKSAAAVQSAADQTEGARGKTIDQMRPMLEAAKTAAADTATEAAAWVEYYRKVGEAAQGEATPITVAPPGVPTVTLTNPIPAPPTVTPVPLARYVGAWTFPVKNGLFHGAQPEFMEVLVTDEDGQAKGTAFGRFKLPAGSTGDPVLRFDFSGPFQPTRTQTFNLVTSDGTKGTIELIPGPAFNLLEVNFQTEQKPDKIRQADVVLVKK
jgi:hypothetical protein